MPQDGEQALLEADPHRLDRVHPHAEADQVAHQVGHRDAVVVRRAARR